MPAPMSPAPTTVIRSICFMWGVETCKPRAAAAKTPGRIAACDRRSVEPSIVLLAWLFAETEDNNETAFSPGLRGFQETGASRKKKFVSNSFYIASENSTTYMKEFTAGCGEPGRPTGGRMKREITPSQPPCHHKPTLLAHT